MKTYKVNHIFYSIQGEGVRTGIPMVFLRFSGCNLKCKFCDTKQHSKFKVMSIEEIILAVSKYNCDYISLCGGEPTLQVDALLINALKKRGYMLGIETNGTNRVPAGIDYIVVSPKLPGYEKNFKDDEIDELKFVLAAGDPLPPHKIIAKECIISPIFDGAKMNRENVAHCVKLIKENQDCRNFRLGVQVHKWLEIK